MNYDIQLPRLNLYIGKHFMFIKAKQQSSLYDSEMKTSI